MPINKPAKKPPAKAEAKVAKAKAPAKAAVVAPELTPSLRRELRAKAHHLHPVVTIGQHGLTPAVLHELDVNLFAHQLIKVRVFSDVRDERDKLLTRICGELDAAPVQHIGKLLVLWRPAPAEEKAPRKHRPEHRPGRESAANAKPATHGDEPRGKRRPLSRPLARPQSRPQSRTLSRPLGQPESRQATKGSKAFAVPPAATTESVMGKSTPQARRPRTPEPRTTSRPPAANASARRGLTHKGAAAESSPPTNRRRQRGNDRGRGG